MNESFDSDVSRVLEGLMASGRPMSKADICRSTSIADKNYLHKILAHLQKINSIRVFNSRSESGENITVYAVNDLTRSMTSVQKRAQDNCLITAVILDESQSETELASVGSSLSAIGSSFAPEYKTATPVSKKRFQSEVVGETASENLTPNSQERTDLASLVAARVNALRPKLLDLSRRNPLILPRLGPRSSSHIQVVDELPSVLFENLASERKMRFRALPSLDENLKDEESVEFQDALSQERATNAEYQASVEELNHDNADDLERYREIERSVKDSVRAKLGMEPRQTKSDVSLPQHAKNHGISPSYELPLPQDQHEDGRHTDRDIQTLLLPDVLDRKLSKIISTCSAWTQETGIHVLYAAFGFLEWKDPKSGENIFAPLVLLPINIEKTRSREGTEFWVVGLEEQGELNTVLQEKLKQDFGIKIDDLDYSDLEAFFEQLRELSPKAVEWKVRRQVVFGVFPSARIAMYHDLDSTKHNFGANSAIRSLLAGSAWGGMSMYGEDYSTDEPEVESKVPCLVMDADSSQFSTVVDVMDGKHLAVEGPPGTGKSQTIVNIVAAALNEGKKVLFVAEKSAALDVVKARLEKIGLGNFVLALQANKASREKVIESISTRLSMQEERAPGELERTIHRFKEARSEIQSYLDLISSPFGQTEFKVFDVMGKAIKTNESLLEAPEKVQRPNIEQIEQFSQLRIEKCLMLSESVSKAWTTTESALRHWEQVTVVDLDRFTAEQICDAAKVFAARLGELDGVEQSLLSAGVSRQLSLVQKIEMRKILQSANQQLEKVEPAVVAKLLSVADVELVAKFAEQLKGYAEKSEELSKTLGDNSVGLEKLQQLQKHLEEVGRNEESLNSLLKRHVDLQRQISETEATLLELKPLLERNQNAKEWSLSSLMKTKALLGQTTKKVLNARKFFEPEELEPEDVIALAKKGKKLVAEYKAFASQFIMTRIKHSADDLAEISSCLKSMSWVSIFDSRVRFAKSSYLQISKASKFEKTDAISSLDQLIEWKESFEKFCSDRKAVALFGKQIDLECDFEEFENLGLFLSELYEALPDESSASLREFVLSASREHLGLIPELKAGGSESATEFENNLKRLNVEIVPFKALAQFVNASFDGASKIGNLSARKLSTVIANYEQLLESARSIESDEFARKVLGAQFDGVKTDANQIRACLEIVLSAKPLLSHIKSLPEKVERGELQSLADILVDLENVSSSFEIAATQLARISGLDESKLRNTPVDQNSIDKWLEAGEDIEGLFAFASLCSALRDLSEQGVGWIATELLNSGIGLTGLAKVVEASIFASMTRHVYSQHSRLLSKYSGRKLDECRESIAKYDMEIQQLSRTNLRVKLRSTAKPPEGITQGRKSELTEMALLKNELGKKRGYISVRELTRRATDALLEIKPCWMMSPLAVAQYLQADRTPFDIVIIDEASQMAPENALGALVRGKQAVVVGDTNQLPPTNFFQKAFSDDEMDEDEAVLEESVLEIANAAFRPARRLKWHYRSRHSALINFSNQMIYNGDLVVFPGPNEKEANFGVGLKKVEGYFKSGLNEKEADAIVSATLQFMRTHRDRSLGIVVLNRKQRDFLWEKFEHALNQDTSAADYVEYWQKKNDGIESFFVKNLENVQGDERDVIFIGTVYGPSEPGAKTANRFGPINGLAGKRRLNVLFSRAKLQILTFTSMESSDISAEEDGNAGAYMLKKWLEYSASGGEIRGLDVRNFTESDFEDYVVQQIQSMGYEAYPQVGAAGYFIDIGVKHPDFPNEFILGIECDGAAYHSSKSARERDRLRQQVLEGLGWKFHRIWSTDWFNDPRKEGNVLREVLSSRMKELLAKTERK